MNYSAPNLWPRKYADIPSQAGFGGVGSFAVITQAQALQLATQLDGLLVSPSGTMQTGNWTGFDVNLDLGTTVQIKTLAGAYGQTAGGRQSYGDLRYSADVLQPAGNPLIDPLPWPDAASRVLSDGGQFTLGNWNASNNDAGRRNSRFSIGIGLSAGVWRLCYAFNFTASSQGGDYITITDPNEPYVPSHSGTWNLFGVTLDWKGLTTTTPTTGPFLNPGITTSYTLY